jgi:RHS repeat-associated protein
MDRQDRSKLTPDQVELLQTCWRLESTEDKALAPALGISVAACHERMRRVMAKLRVTNRSGLLARAVKLELIPGVRVSSLPLQTDTIVSLAAPVNLPYSAGTFGGAMVLMRPERREGRRMGVVNYTTLDGEIIYENRNGVERDYVNDPQGNVVALLDNTQTKTDTFNYWPYGEVKSRTGTTATPFQFIGSQGYYRDSASKTYVRARYLDVQKGRWLTEDPLGITGAMGGLYGYAALRPTTATDPSGYDIGYPDDCPKEPKGQCFKCYFQRLLANGRTRPSACQEANTYCQTAWPCDGKVPGLPAFPPIMPPSGGGPKGPFPPGYKTGPFPGAPPLPPCGGYVGTNPSCDPLWTAGSTCSQACRSFDNGSTDTTKCQDCCEAIADDLKLKGQDRDSYIKACFGACHAHIMPPPPRIPFP